MVLHPRSSCVVHKSNSLERREVPVSRSFVPSLNEWAILGYKKYLHVEELVGCPSNLNKKSLEFLAPSKSLTLHQPPNSTKLHAPSKPHRSTTAARRFDLCAPCVENNWSRISSSMPCRSIGPLDDNHRHRCRLPFISFYLVHSSPSVVFHISKSRRHSHHMSQ